MISVESRRVGVGCYAALRFYWTRIFIYEIRFSVKEAHFRCEMYQTITNNFLVNNSTKKFEKIFTLTLKNVFYFHRLRCQAVWVPARQVVITGFETQQEGNSRNYA